jgi:hypothetical protein
MAGTSCAPPQASLVALPRTLEGGMAAPRVITILFHPHAQREGRQATAPPRSPERLRQTLGSDPPRRPLSW